MYLKFLVHVINVLVTLLLFTHISSVETSYESTLNLGEYPYLVLIEIDYSSGGGGESGTLVNGVLCSATKVLTLSPRLAALPSGRLSASRVKVYAGMVTLDNKTTAPARVANRIVTNLMSPENNAEFPTLVLLGLDKPFELTSAVRPATFNIGHLGETSYVVGWANDSQSISRPVLTMSASTCDRSWSLPQHARQVCAFSPHQPQPGHPADLRPGALLVTDGTVTGLLQVTTSQITPNGAAVMLLVRLSYYTPWLQYYVLDPVPATRPNVSCDVQKIVESSPEGDDINIDPWNSHKGNRGTSRACVMVSGVVDASLLLIIQLWVTNLVIYIP